MKPKNKELTENPYRPMPTTLEGKDATDAPTPKTIKFEENVKVTLGGLLSGTISLTKKHFIWAFVVLVVPSLLTASGELLAGEFHGTPVEDLLSFYMPLLFSVPWEFAAGVAVVWRMVGSKETGPLDKHPLKAPFYGFRYMGTYMLYILILGGIMLCCSLPVLLQIGIIPMIAGGSFGRSWSESSNWRMLAVTAAPCVLLFLFLFSRWFIAFEIALAEDTPLRTAMRRSAAFMGFSRRSSLPFFFLLFILLNGIPIVFYVADIQILDLLMEPTAFSPFLSSILSEVFDAATYIIFLAGAASVFFAYKGAKRTSGENPD